MSLGLKPISDAPSASKTADDLAQENFDKRKAADAASRDSTALQARIDKARNAKERARKLGGIGLGEAEVKIEGGKGDDENDTKGWVKKQKRRQKELAEKRARELDEMERRAAEEEGKVLYGEDDLKGIKVAHGEDDFEEGEETVLTLKDSRILDDEGASFVLQEASWLASKLTRTIDFYSTQTTNCTTSASRNTNKRPKRSR